MIIVLVVLVGMRVRMNGLPHRYILVVVAHFSLPLFLQVTVVMLLHSMNQKMIIIIRNLSFSLKRAVGALKLTTGSFSVTFDHIDYNKSNV